MESQNSTAPEASDDGRQRALALVGKVLSQRYRIDALLAFGGMGAVFKGEHVLMRKRIAIKVLLPGAKDVAQLVDRFQREAVVGAHVSHPNIASATDFGLLDDGSHFLVLEYVKGKTLYDLIQEIGALDLDRAMGIARQMAVGLHAAHEAGVVHRDIKPHNVMLVDLSDNNRTASVPALLLGRDFIKIIDFGFASVSEERLSIPPQSSARPSYVPERITQQGEIFGTISYLAPEAAMGMDAVDARSDLYALGIVMYLMLTGRHPYDETEPAAIFRRHLTTPPPAFKVRNPAVVVPPAVEAITMKLLAKDPARRYQTALELVGAIDEAMGLSALLGAVRISSPSLPSDLLAQAMASADSSVMAAAAVASPSALTQAAALQRAGSSPPLPQPGSSSASLGAIAVGGPSSESAPLTSPSPGTAADQAPARAPAAPRASASRWVLAAAALGVVAVGAVAVSRRPAAGDGVATLQATDRPAASPPPSSGRLDPSTGPTDRVDPSTGPTGAPSAADSAGSSAAGSAAAASASAAGSATAEAPGAASAAGASSAAAAGSAAGGVGDEAAANAWKLRLRASAGARDWPNARTAFFEVAQRSPAVLGDPVTLPLVSDLVVAMANPVTPETERVFALLEGETGAAGLDVLFDLTMRKGGSRAAERAAEILKKPGVLARASAAMRVAHELRASGCGSDELLERAVSEGDGRALQVLRAMREHCGPTRGLEKANHDLFAKLSK